MNTTTIQITPSPALREALGRFISSPIPPPLPAPPLPALPVNGIGRLGFAGASIGFGLFAAVLQEYYKHVAGSGNTIFTVITMVLMLLTYVVALTLRFYRLKSIGYNGWWALLTIVPLFQLFDLAGLILPANFRTTRKLDTAAQVSLAILAAIVILVAMFIGLSLLGK